MTAITPDAVRHAVAEDAATIAWLVREAFAYQPVVLQPPPSALGETAARVAEHLAAGGGGALATLDGTDMGCCLWLLVNKDELHLSRLAVIPQFRRLGVASMLLDAAKAWAVEAGAKRITLSTRLALIGNRRFFASAGFRETAFTSRPGVQHHTSVEMAYHVL